MSRALIVGPRDELEAAVDTLYSLKLLHIVDHEAGQDELDIGKPLPKAAEASEVLVKLRSIASVLQVQETKAAPAEPVTGNLREKILSLELNISEEDAARKKVQGLLADLTRRIEEITPFAQLPLSLADYRGYESLEVFVGKVPREITGFESVTTEYEAFQVPGFLAVFVAKEHAGAMREFLAHRAFAAVPIPEGDGHPREILAEYLREKERWEKRLAEIDERLTTLRERYAGFLATAKAHLEIEVEKAEAPLRFAVTEHTFIAEGWVPQETFPKLKEEMERLPGMFVTELETDHGSEPPVLLRNVRAFRPFEMLVNLFGTPSYHEIDPTFIIAMAFPILFGVMIGDAGYGLAWLLFGLWLLRTLAKEPGDFRDLVIAITWGGFWSFVFGLFFFGDMFGIPFHPPHGAIPGTVEYVNWSSILGFDIPFRAMLHKLEQVSDFIVLSFLAAYVHLGIGFITGFLNDVGHSKKHAVGKIGWFLVLTGIFVILIVRAARWPGVGRTLWETLLGWFPRDGIEMKNIGFVQGINPIPMAAIYLLVAGVGMVLVAEGGLHIMEVFSLVANVVSYGRLAGVGVAKAAMAFAFNAIVLENMIFPWEETGNPVPLIAGLAVAFLAHAMIFLLGAISAAIQAIRLNYVEFFLKFYKGVGTLFRPFGARARMEV